MSNNNRKHCVVIGGGLAGLASAVWLSENGHKVTLLERRGTLGGRAHGLPVPQMDDVVDNGQHIMVTGFVDLMRYLESVGTRQHMDWEPMGVRGPSGKSAIAADAWGAIQLITGGIPGCKGLTRWRTMVAQIKMIKESFSQPDDLDEISCDEWFERLGMPKIAREVLWDLSAVGLLNEKTQLASAKALADLFVTFYKVSREHKVPCLFGHTRVDLNTLYIDGAKKVIAEHGNDIVYRAIARQIKIENGQVTGVTLADNSVIDADAVVCAVPVWNLENLLDDLPEVDRYHKAKEVLKTVPIISLYVWLDRPIGTDWWFELIEGGESLLEVVCDMQRMHPGRSTENGWCYSLTVSAALELNEMDNAEIIDTTMDMLGKFYPAAKDAQLLNSHVVRINKATFSQRPGSAGVRPKQETSAKGLVVIGDWTATEWPATMGGAVQSAAWGVDIIERQFSGCN